MMKLSGKGVKGTSSFSVVCVCVSVMWYVCYFGYTWVYFFSGDKYSLEEKLKMEKGIVIYY